jgi:signal transduction histidine kinase
LELDLEPLPRRPDAPVELACFRIAQEALTNVLRHAGAATVAVRLRQDGAGSLTLDVVDDGRGFDPGTASQGLGLVTMRERARLAGGTLDLGHAMPGTRIRVTLPMTHAPATVH